MAIDNLQGVDQGLVAVIGAPVRQVFAPRWTLGELVQRPAVFQKLSDIRIPSDAARAEALAGVAPSDAQSRNFDPLLGPFSDPVLAQSAWAQSLEFLRDIKSAAIGTTDLSKAWIVYWLNGHARVPSTEKPPLPSRTGAGSRSTQMIWRARRVLNGLSHVLTFIDELDDQTRERFWQSLYYDIARLAVPSVTVRSKLTERFDPLSPRANWLRAVALLGVEVAFPELLRRRWIEKSLNSLKNALQVDGLIRGGSVIATLSAAAELSMLTPIPATLPLLTACKTALISLRRQNGTLVTFGSGAADYHRLLDAILGPKPDKPVSLLLASGIVRADAHDTIIWMRSARAGSSWCGSCEIETNGSVLLTSSGANVSGLAPGHSAQVIKAGCKKRDDQDFVTLETDATVKLSGQVYSHIRQIKLAADGSRIDGQDVFRPDLSRRDPGARPFPEVALHFVLPDSSTCHLSNDKRSVLILTAPQHMWRFRCETMDISLKISAEARDRNSSPFRHCVMVCERLDASHQSEFIANWQFLLEESV